MRTQTRRKTQGSIATDVKSASIWMIVAMFFVLASLYVPA